MPIAQRDRPQHLHNRDHTIVIWYVTMPPDVTVDELLQPETWSAVANRQLRPFHRIQVDAETGEWSRTFMVQTVGQNTASLALERDVTYGKHVAVQTGDALKYKIEYKGPVHLHQVVRLSDHQVVAKQIRTKDEANRWIADRVKIEAA